MPGYMSEMGYYSESDLAVAGQFHVDNPRNLEQGPGVYLVAMIELPDAAKEKKLHPKNAVENEQVGGFTPDELTKVG